MAYIRTYIHTCMRICDRILEKLPVMHKDKYLVIQLFNELYLKNAWSCLHTILHHCTIINGISVYELFNELLTELLTILDSFSLIPQVLT